MKNGRSMKGHKRVAVIVGEYVPKRKRQSPLGGWDVSCSCGWQGGNWRNRTLANQAYRKHIDYVIDECPFKCKQCGVEKPVTEMRPDYRYICLKCFSALGNEWQQKHPKASAAHKQNHQLLKRLGISLSEAENLLAEQGGVCPICEKAISYDTKPSPHVDHDHATGKVRGVLCFLCNAGLGQFADNIDLLYSAIAYLKRHTL